MKQLLPLFLLVWSIAMSAQSWCPPGAQWTYEYWNWASGYEKITYEKDTAIQQQPCKKLSRTIVACHPGSSLPCQLDTITHSFYTYQSGDSVYFYYGQRFRPVYFFGAHVGDTLLYTNPVYYNSGFACDSIIYLRVDSTGKCIINNDSLRFYLTRQIQYDSSLAGKHLYIEKIGSLAVGLLPEYQCYTDGEWWNPRCYSDNNFVTYHIDTSVACDYVFTDITEPDDGDFSVYPNPVQNILQLSSPYNSGSVSVSNLFGQLLAYLAFQSNTIAMDVTILPPGIYLVQLTSSMGVATTRRFVKE